jgi:hypothetical protein
LAKVSMFVKREKLDKCEEEYAPRVISAQEPPVTAFTGPVMTVVQDWLHWLWDGEKVPVLFAAGASVTKLSLFYSEMMKKGGQFFETDMSNFDAHVVARLQKLFLKFVHAFGFEEEVHFWALRNAQADVLEGRGACGTRFRTPPNIKSGVADTCVCNTFVNAVMHLFAIAKSGGIVDDNGQLSLRLTLDRVDMLVMGDDNLGRVDGSCNIANVRDFLRRLGMVPKFKKVEPEDAVFLNMLPYPLTEDTIQFAPKIGRIFARIGWACRDFIDARAYLCAVGKGFEASCKHVPILRALVSRLIAHGKRGADGKNHNRGLELDPRFRAKHFGYVQNSLDGESFGVDPTPLTFEYIKKRYCLSSVQVSDLETRIGVWEDAPALVSDQLIERAIELDC